MQPFETKLTICYKPTYSMKVNRLKQLWKENKTALNAWITFDSVWIAELMVHSGLDAMTVDAQQWFSN